MQVLQVLQVLFHPTHQIRETEDEDEDEEEGGVSGKGMGGTEWQRNMSRSISCGRGAWAPQAPLHLVWQRGHRRRKRMRMWQRGHRQRMRQRGHRRRKRTGRAPRLLCHRRHRQRMRTGCAWESRR